MQSVLVTGGNRGIGLSLVQQLLKLPNPPAHVIATCRCKEKATNLTSLLSAKQLKILEIDLTKFNEYDRLTKEIATITQDMGLNVLINNAGITTKYTRLPMVKIEQLMENFLINTVAPIMLTRACLPLLKQASKKNGSLPVGVSRAAVVNISSVLGSVSQNSDGGFYPYRCSKTALNAATKSMSIDMKADGILVTAIHPGWCKTDMGGKNAPLETDTATAQIIQTLQNLQDKDNGTFIQYDGKPINW